jgi:hypothetical protein
MAQKKPKNNSCLVKFFYWLPRILAICFTVFISLFALDVLGQPGWFLGLLIHLVPTYILIAVTVLAWKNEMFGGLLFLLFGVLMLFFTHFESLIVSLPIMVIGVLFLSRKYLLMV